MTAEELTASSRITYSDDTKAVADCNFYIVTVPTPIDPAKRPDLSALIAASRMIGSVLSQQIFVVYNRRSIPA